VGDRFEAFGSDWTATPLARTVGPLVEAGDRGVDVDHRVTGSVDRKSFEGEAVVVERGRVVVSTLEARSVLCPSGEELESNRVDVGCGEFTSRVPEGDERVRGE